MIEHVSIGTCFFNKYIKNIFYYVRRNYKWGGGDEFITKAQLNEIIKNSYPTITIDTSQYFILDLELLSTSLIHKQEILDFILSVYNSESQVAPNNILIKVKDLTIFNDNKLPSKYDYSYLPTYIKLEEFPYINIRSSMDRFFMYMYIKFRGNLYELIISTDEYVSSKMSYTLKKFENIPSQTNIISNNTIQDTQVTKIEPSNVKDENIES